jgi:hypothetical protein
MSITESIIIEIQILQEEIRIINEERYRLLENYTLMSEMTPDIHMAILFGAEIIYRKDQLRTLYKSLNYL